MLLAAVLALLALVIGVGLGAALTPRILERKRRRAVEQSGITVSQMLEHVVSGSPVGIVVVDTYRDVVYTNDRARELGLVKDRLLNDRAWLAAERTLATGEDGEVDLSPRKRANPGRSGLSVRGHVRLLTEDDRRFAVVYVDDQSEHARMEATRRDFVANVSHELKTPVGAMGVLAEALLASAEDPDTVRRFAEKMLAESNRLANMVGELIDLSRLQGGERLPDLEAVEVDHVVAEALSRYKDRLAKLQDSLGALNDIAVHHKLLTKLGADRDEAKPRLMAFAAGAVVGTEYREVAALLQTAGKAARKLRRTKDFWI